MIIGKYASQDARRRWILVGVFLVVALGTIVFRSESIFQNQLWSDDIWQKAVAQKPTALEEFLNHKHIKFRFYWTFHLWSLGTFDSAVLIRLAYVVLFGISASLATRQMAAVTGDISSAAILVTCAFLNPSTTLVFIFIVGSYGVLTLFLILAAVQCLIVVFQSEHVTRKSIVAQALFAVFVLLLVHSFSTGLLVLLAVPLLPWWRAPLRADRLGFRMHAISTGVILLVGVAHGVLGLLANHPYAAMPGRRTGNPVEIIGNLARLSANIVVNYVDPRLSTGQPTGEVRSLTTTVMVVLLLVGLLGYAVIKDWLMYRSRHIPPSPNVVRLVDLLPFLLMATVLSMAGATTIRITHLWHPFVPSVFGVAACLVAFRILLPGRSVVCPVIVVVLLTVYSFSLQNSSFGNSARSLANISTAMKEVSWTWPNNAQIVLVTNPPTNTGINASIRSLPFLQQATGRSDMKLAVIESSSRITPLLMKHMDEFDDAFRMYEIDSSSGVWNGVNIIVSGDGELVLIDGLTGMRHSLDFAQFLCSTLTEAHTIVTPLDLELTAPVATRVRQTATGETLELMAEERTRVAISIPEGSLYLVDIRLEADPRSFDPRNSAYSEVTPPMPLLAPNSAIYQTPTGYRVQGRSSGQFVGPVGENGITEMTYLGCEGGLATLFVDGLYQALLEPGSVSGEWLFGSGYKQRVWNGQLTFTVTATGAQMSEVKVAQD